MKPGSRETIPTISEVVREAAAICDPEGTRLVFEGSPPAPLAEWLAAREVEL
jgi:hypothetical protein